MPRLLFLSEVDGAVVGLEGGFGAAAVDGAGDGAVHFHLEFAVGRIVLPGDGCGAEFEIEVAVDFSVIGAQFDVGFEVGRQGDVDGAVHAAEGERLARVHAIHGDLHGAVHGVGQHGSGHAGQGNLAVHAVDIHFALDAFDGDFAMHGVQL